MSTLSPTTTGEDRISPIVLKVHSAFPLFASTAWNTPERSPMYTTPFATAGDDSPISAVLYLQRTAPDCRSSAISSPADDPTNAAPSATAADDSMEAPASNVHITFRLGAS